MSLNLTPQLFVDGAWVTYPGYASDGWEVSIGPDVESGIRPSSISITLNNDDLSMDPSNVKSSLYGKIGRNTKTRLQLNGITLTHAEASSWQPDATVEHVPGVRGKSWTDLQAEGLLRRLGRWTDPIRSAMTRQALSIPNLVGYWSMEDDADSAQLSNEVPGGRVGIYSGDVTLQGDDGAGGADGAIKMVLGGGLRGDFTSPSGNGYQISWATKLAVIPPNSTFLTMFSWSDTARRVWSWQVNNTHFQININDPDGTLVEQVSFAYAGREPNQWIRYRMKVTSVGNTITYEPALYLQDGITEAGITDTFVDSPAGRPTSWKITGNAWTDGGAYGHVLATTNTTVSLVGGAAGQSFNGYLGEVAWLRFSRLMAEEGLTAFTAGANVINTPMGRQRPGIFLDLINECAVSEGGFIYDSTSNIALTFVSYGGLVNKTPVLALTKSQVMAPLRKTVDDVGVVNDVTVKNWDGSEFRTSLEIGALSTDVPPAGIGRIKGTVEVNISKTAFLEQRANWEMRKGTLDRPRYLSVSVNLLQNPSLTNTVTGARPGDWISISGVEPDTVMLRIISINRKGNAVEDVVTFNCLPAELYQVGVYSAATSRYDSGSTTLAGAITTTSQTSISLTTAKYNDRWSSSGVPYDIKIGGERMTVTAMTTGSGTGPVTQTATVTRAVNGVAKTHLATTEVHLFAPVRYALG